MNNDTLLYANGTTADASSDGVAAAIASKEFFWLDLLDIDGEDAEVLSDLFKLHPLAVEDAEQFGQRPKMDEYDDYLYIVVYGAGPDGAIEIHVVYSASWIITVRRGHCEALTAVRERVVKRAETAPLASVGVLYRLVDALVDSFFPVLATFDDEIDSLEDAILERPTEEQLGSLFAMKRALISYRKVVSPQRDLFANFVTNPSEFPGMTVESERYFRDVYDHLIRISDLVDSYRDLLSGALDTHLSTVSNRLNQVMKQLTIIATIFLPLSFLTGFFGQNFGWMVNKIGSAGAFFGIGIGVEILTVIGLVTMFKRRGWL